MFYRTIDLTKVDFQQARTTADKQEKRVLAIFEKFAEYSMTATEVKIIYDRLYGPILLTSIRRAISDLKKESHLYDTGLQRPGLYNRPNKVWKLIKAMVSNG